MSLVYILYVRGNCGDMDDTEYYVEHVFAILRVLDAETSTVLLSLNAALHDRNRNIYTDSLDRHYMVFMSCKTVYNINS